MTVERHLPYAGVPSLENNGLAHARQSKRVGAASLREDYVDRQRQGGAA